MKNGAITLVLAAATVALAACGSDSTTTPPVSKIVNFTATLSPANEPSVAGNPTGTGTFTATLDTSTKSFRRDAHTVSLPAAGPDQVLGARSG